MDLGGKLTSAGPGGGGPSHSPAQEEWEKFTSQNVRKGNSREWGES